MSRDKRVIVGLGNPGKEYEFTRHNLGFMVVDYIAQEQGVKFHSSSFTKALVAEIEVEGVNLLLFKPQTFMNNSGQAIEKLFHYFKLSASDVLTICDDKHLLFGEMRLRNEGSHGGHNGLRSIIDCLGTKDFPRLRMGIGPAPLVEVATQHQHNVDFVLGEFSSAEKKLLNSFVEDAARCCFIWLKDGITNAMAESNKRKGYGKN